jgi:HAD superfamily hydrolase (TIGR01549 family)
MGRVASAVILDLDGTVWDSRPFYATAAGGSSAAKEERALSELKAAGSAATLLKRSGMNKNAFRRHCNATGNLTLYPDVLTTITELSERGTPLGAVTNLPSWMVNPMLACRGLDEMFWSVVTYGWTTRNKPWPDPLLLCCRELEVKAGSDCWYIGDTDGDCTAARRAGLSFAWASWGYGEHTPAGADLRLTSISAIASL